LIIIGLNTNYDQGSAANLWTLVYQSLYEKLHNEDIIGYF